MECRILYLVGQLGPGGGIGKQLCFLLQAMDRERYEPAVVVWNYSEDDVHVPKLRALGVQLYALPDTRSAAKKLIAFRRLVKALRPEVVHSYYFYTNFAVEYATLGLKVVPIGSIRNDFIIERRLSGKVLGRLSARWPRVQVCNSRAAQNNVMRSRGPFKPRLVHAVRNGLDIDQFRFNPMLPSEPRLIAIGRLDPEKRWDRLVKVLASIAARGLAVKVRHVGNGPLLGELKTQAKALGVDGLMNFLGYQRDVLGLLAESTFLIHTADHEGCPNVVMEAMACGRAVISTDAGDVPYLVEDGKTGFVVRRGDDATLVERVVKLITDRDLCRDMGEAGRERAERKFGLNRLVVGTLAAYRAAGWRDS